MPLPNNRKIYLSSNAVLVSNEGRHPQMSFGPLAVILDDIDFVAWKHNLNIVLTPKEHKFVLIGKCPLGPNVDSTVDDVKEFRRWKKFDEMAHCYILASLANVLQHQHQSMGTAVEMMTNLGEMFGHLNRVARQNAMRVLMMTQMPGGTRSISS